MQKRTFRTPWSKKARGAAVSGAGGADDAAQDELAALLGTKPKRKAPSLKRVSIIAGAVVAAGALAFGGYKLLGGARNGGTTYREYTVQYGDITVGQNESSSISLDRETVQFPVEATVQEVYVKEGSSLNAGDPMVKLDVNDVTLGLTSYQLEVKLAELELQKAQLDQQTKLLAAEQQLETSTLNGELAALIKSNTKEELQQAYEKAEKELADAKADYERFCAINTTFDADYTKLKNLENTRDNLDEELTSYKALQTNAKTFEDAETSVTKSLSSLASEISWYKATYHPTDSSGVVTVADALAEAYQKIINGTIDISQSLQDVFSALSGQEDARSLVSAWNTYLSALTTYNAAAYGKSGYTYAQLTILVNNLNEQLTSAKTAYTKYYEYYKDIYGDIEDGEDMADAVYDAETAAEKYKLALAQQGVTVEQKGTAADQAYDTAANAAEVASTTYDLTDMELTQAVDEAQEEYDSVLKQLEDVQSLITNDGIVYAPCDGMVASLNVEPDDELSIFIDSDTHEILQYATILTMTDIADVFVPVTISEEDILSVYIGQPASVTMNSFANRTFDATVDSITVESSRSGAATVSYTVNVKFDGVNALDMYEGMSADVTLIQRAAPDVTYINNQAVTYEDGVSTVLVKDADGKGVKTVVTTGFSDGRYVEILSGLKEGDVVLVESAVGQK